MFDWESVCVVIMFLFFVVKMFVRSCNFFGLWYFRNSGEFKWYVINWIRKGNCCIFSKSKIKEIFFEFVFNNRRCGVISCRWLKLVDLDILGIFILWKVCKWIIDDNVWVFFIIYFLFCWGFSIRCIFVF